MEIDQLPILFRVATELFERLNRISQYVDQVDPGETGENKQLKETIQNALGEIERTLFDRIGLITQLPAADGEQLPFRDEILRTLFSDLAKLSKWFLTLHELLAYLPRQTVLAETVQLISGTFGNLYNEYRPSIILGSLFNALEYDFFKLVRKRLADIQDIYLTESKRIVLQLPICDKDSPLVWSILGHELGHAIDADKGYSQQVASEVVTDPESSAFALVKAWCKEMSADLIAVKALGPSPALALLNLEYCLFPNKPLYKWTTTHPATKWRLKVVSKFLSSQIATKDYLEQERALFDSAWEYSVDHFEPLPANRQKIREDDSRLFEQVIQPLADKIERRVNELDLPTSDILEESVLRGLKRLSKQTPIAAQGVTRTALRQRISEYEDWEKAERDTEERKAEFEGLLSAFQERHMSLPSILLCGFLRRQELLSTKLRTDNNQLSRKNVEELCGDLSALDRLLANSIESSAVCSHLEESVAGQKTVK